MSYNKHVSIENYLWVGQEGISNTWDVLSISTCMLTCTIVRVHSTPTSVKYSVHLYEYVSYSSKDNVRRRYRILVRLYKYTVQVYSVQISELQFIVQKLNSCMWRLPLASFYSLILSTLPIWVVPDTWFLTSHVSGHVTSLFTYSYFFSVFDHLSLLKCIYKVS